MTKLEMFFQNASRAAEVPIIKSPNAFGEGGEGEATGAFDALLKNISEQPKGTPLHARVIPADGTPSMKEGVLANDAAASSGERGDAALPLPESTPDDPVAAKLDQQLTFLIQAGGVPYNGTTPMVQTVSQQEKGLSSRASLLDMVQLPTDENIDANVLQGRASAQLKASVVHQETHFKPVPAGMMQNVTKPQGNGLQGTATSLSAVLGAQSVAPERGIEPAKVLAIPSEALAAAQKGMAEQVSPVAVSSGNEETALPMAMLQRIANAVAAESKQASAQEASQATQSANSTSHVVAKASEGVVRILNIQLHPAELGRVTVKMRLAGDTLEMELQTSSEETAELLKKDSEKLSSLLRTSGYRPDSVVIVTAVADTQAQEGSPNQRQQSGSQPQAGGSQQGTAHSDEQRRGNPQEFETGNQRERKSTVDEKVSSSGTGDLYL